MILISALVTFIFEFETRLLSSFSFWWPLFPIHLDWQVSIMQIASEKVAYIFDLIKLYDDAPDVMNSCLFRILQSPRILKLGMYIIITNQLRWFYLFIFTSLGTKNKDLAHLYLLLIVISLITICDGILMTLLLFVWYLGYNFQCDMHQLAQSYPKLDCFKRYEMLLDIQKVFKEPCGGLSGLVKVINLWILLYSVFHWFLFNAPILIFMMRLYIQDTYRNDHLMSYDFKCRKYWELV